MKKSLLVLLWCLYLGVMHAQVIYVDADATGTNDGTTWQNAYNNLSEAIDAAQSGNELWVAAGIYCPTHQPNYAVGSADPRFNHFTLKNGVSIYGGFAGDESSVEQRDLTAYKTIISGDIDQNDNIGENGYVTSYSDVVGSNSLKLFYFPTGSTIDNTAVLDGFVLAGAVADNDVFPYMGGAAFLAQDASPKVINCEFYGNYAKHSGGAIWINNSSMIIENCTFSGNYAESHAGAVYFGETSAKLKGCTFTNNSGKYGGAVYVVAGNDVSLIEDCDFNGNEGRDNGGAISIAAAKVLLKNTEFVNNTAGTWGGGVVFHNGCDVDMVNCTVNSNYAGSWGGGIGTTAGGTNNRVTIRIVNSKIQGNECGSYYGGGLALAEKTDCKIYNTLFSGNKISTKATNVGGEAIAVEQGSTVEIYNSTFVQGPANGMADFRVLDGTSFKMYNSIVWDWDGEFYLGSTANVEVYNSRSNDYKSINNNNNNNPWFYTDPGSITSPTTDGNWSLLQNSIMNNKGVNTYLPKDEWDLDNDGNTTEPIPYDLNGNPRVFAGVVDLGCYEQQLYTQSGNAIGLWDNTHMKIGSSGIALNGTDFTIELWYYMQDGMNDSWHNIFGNDPAVSIINRGPSLYVFQNDRLHYGYGDGTNWNSNDTEKVLKLNQWNHIALSFSNATNTLKAYANGEFLEEFTGAGEVSPTALFQLNNNESLHGVIDEFRIWREERTEQELLANMNTTLTGNEENLALYYNFDQITNGEIEDLAGNSNGIISKDASGNLECGLYNSEAIATPVLKDVSGVGIDGFKINWKPVDEATEYYIDVATDNNFENLVVSNQPTGGETTYMVSGLSRGTVYYYKVTSNFGGAAYQYAHTATKLNPPGNALVFDEQTYVDATDVCKYDFSEATMECWVKIDPVSTENPVVFACNTSDFNNNYLLMYSKVNNCFYVAQTGIADQLIANTSVAANEWHHVALTIDHDGGNSRFYLDGADKGTFTTNAYPFPYGSYLSLGQEFDGPGGVKTASNFLIGELDEFRVWDKALSQAEIQASMSNSLTGNEENLVTYYNFDLQTGTKVVDNAKIFDGEIIGNVNWVESTIGLNNFVVEASAQNTTGFTLTWNAVSGATDYFVDVATDAQFVNKQIVSATTTATTYNASGLIQGTKYYIRIVADNGDTSMVNYTNTMMEIPGNALWLDGKDDYVDISQITEMGNKGLATMECWAYVDPTETHGRFLAINTSTGGNKYLLSYEASKGYCLYDANAGTTISSYDFRKGAWVHLAVTMDGADITQFYMNGELVGTATNGHSPLYSGNLISIGQEYDGTEKGDFLKGAIDEVRFWDVIRTEEEINANMYKTLAGNETNLLAYYDFDQSEGQFVYEKVNGLDGTIIGQPQWIQSEAIITPLLSTVDNITENAAFISWTSVDNAADYKIEVASDINFSSIIQTIPTTLNATSYELIGLEENTDYFVRVASQTSRWSAWSMVEEFSTLLTPPGNALVFNGLDGEVNVDNVMETNWSEVTLEAWVKLPPYQINGYPRIIGNYGAGGFALNLWNQTNQPYFEFHNLATGTRDEVKCDYSVADNIWHHLAATYDGVDMKLYLDGELVATHNNPGVTIKKATQNTGIGNQNGAAPLNGALDEIRIWNIARTQAELKEYAHKTLNGNEPGLVSYFNLDVAKGATFKDEAGNFDGTMTGGVTWAESKALITPFVSAATNIDDNGFTANWEAIPNASKYILRVATDKLLTQIVEGMDSIDVGNVLSYDISGLTESTNYYYGVMSITDRASAWSAPANVKTTGTAVGELCINLQGNNNYIDISAAIPKLAGKNAGAVTGWFKAKEEGLVFRMEGADGHRNSFWLWVGNANMDRRSLVFEIWRDESIVQSMSVMDGNETYLDDKWHHIAIIIGDGNNRILLDGEEKEIYYVNNYGNELTQEFTNITNPQTFVMGKDFSIQLDEFAFYKNPITNEEAIERAHSKLTGSEVGLIAYYNFDNRNVNDMAFGRNGSKVGTVSYESANVTKTPFLNDPVQGVTIADLSWEAVDGATEYVIDVATDKYFQNKIIKNISISENAYHLANLDKNTKYYYHVKAKVNSQWSEYSATGEIFTLPGKSLTLDGVDDYLIADEILNYSSEEATIECWINSAETSMNPAGRSVIWALNSFDASSNHYVLVYYPHIKKISLWEDDVAITEALDVSCDLINSWHHVAVSLRKGAESYIYIDGKEVLAFTPSIEALISGYRFSIGQEWDTGTPMVTSDFFKGEIDEFRVWNIALTQEQVRANMNLSEPEGANEHYIAHYTFDEIADGNIIKDWAKYNNATIVNGATIKNSEGVIIPITLEATNATPGSFDMHINDIASAASFEIEVAYDATFVPPLAINKNIGRELDYTVDGLCPGVKYYFRARAIYNEKTLSNWSTADTIWTVDQDAAIQNFVASEGDYSQQLKLSWECTNSYLITDFEIKRRIEGESEFKYLATVVNDKDFYQHIDTLAEPGTYYEYTLQGLSYCNGSDTKIDTSNVGYNIPTLELSKEVNDLTQEAYIRLDYEFHSNFLKNVEFIRTNIENGTSQTFTEIKDSLIYRDGAVTLCTPYTYQVVAKTYDYGDVKSHSKAFTLEEDIFDAIDTLDASKGYYDNKITLNWVSYKQNIIDEYQISRRKFANGDNWQVVKVIEKGTTQVWIDEDANAGEYYEYLIVGYGTCGEATLKTDSVTSVGFRQPEGSIAGQITYEGGNPVFDVKLTVGYDDGSTMGNCLYFDGSDELTINPVNDFDFSEGKTLEMWISFEPFENGYVLYNNSGLVVDYVNTGSLSAWSGSAMVSYNIKNDTKDVWTDSTWNHLAITANADSLIMLVNGERVAKQENATALAFDTTQVATSFIGYIEELRVWNTMKADSLINRYKGLMFGRDEDNLICNLRFDEKRGYYAFDHSRSDDEPNKSHAKVNGATWSNAVPSLATLSLGAKTEPNGNYTANGIWFKGSGDSYSITPSFGVHEFDPATKSMLISENSLVYSNQNFTDISAFKVTGNVKYYGANFPVQDVMLAVDGQVCITSEGTPVTTDADGNFEIEVPIGEHYISVSKIQHTFSDGYFPPKDENGGITYHLFDNPKSGIQFVDSTFITVAGRIVGGTVEGDKEIGFAKSKNNLGVADFTVEAAKGYPIDGVNNTVTVTTNAQTGEYEVKLYPEVYQFVVDATHNVGNELYEFASIDDLSVINLSNPMLENIATDTVTITEIVGADTTINDTVYEYKYHLKRNWIYRSVPSIEVLSADGASYFSDSILTVIDANKDSVEFTLINADGSNKLDYPAFTKGGFYNTVINVFEEYQNVDNGDLDRVKVQDGKVTVINGLATYPAPVDYPIKNGKVDYEFIGGFPNPTLDNTNPELSYTKAFEVHSYTGDGGSMHSVWPSAGNPYRGYVFGGIPTGQNFITQGPDQVDFILRDPPGSNSSATFEEGFTVSSSTSTSWENSSTASGSVAVDLGWSVTTFVGFGAGAIFNSELIAETEVGISRSSTYSGGRSTEVTTTFTKSYSTSDDPAYVGAMGDLFFGHSTNITYGVSNCIGILPAGTGEENLGTDVEGFTVGLNKGLNLGLQFGTSFIYTQNHIENYLIPDLEMFYEKLLSEGDADSANYYMQQADLWRKTLAENEYQKYWAIKRKQVYPENENVSFDAGAIYEQSMETEITETQTSAFEFNIEKSISEELGFEALGMGTTIKMGYDKSGSKSTESESSNTQSTTIGFTLNDGDQGDYFSLDVLKDPFGNGPVFSTLGGQSACPYEDGSTVKYADFIGKNTPSDFNNEFQLNYPTMKIEVPVISAENAIVAGVPDNEPAVFVLKLSNQSEVNADNWFTLKLDAASNPYGAKLKMDGAAIVNGVSIMIPGGTTLTKTLELEKGQDAVNDYENINLILHSQCQFDPTDDVDDISDTVTITANFVPTCTDVEVLNPTDNWLMNAEANDLMPVKIGGYNINHGTFEKVAFQYKAEAASSWNTLAMFFNDTTDYGVYAGEKFKINGSDVIFYDWDMEALQDKSYQIRAVSLCTDGSVTESPAHTGILDGVRPQVFGTPSPADGILEPNDEIMITFNETIEEGAVTYYNIDVQGVLNGAEINHGTSVQLDGVGDYIETPQGINLSNSSYSIEFWMKKAVDATGVVFSQGTNPSELLEINCSADSIELVSGSSRVKGINNFDDANWHHYAVAYNNSTNNLAIYIDDQLIVEKAMTATQATGNIVLGKSLINGNNIAVNIHDMRIWRKALSYTDIIEQMNKSLVGNEFGLIANWPMNEAEGTLLLDKAHSRNATLFGNWLVEPSSMAYSFNGTDQALSFETGAIPLNSEMDMTIEFWFKGNVPTATATLFSNGNAAIDSYDANKTLNVNLTTAGIIEVVSGSQKLATTASYTDNLWHHMAYVVNRRGYASLYIDAEKVNSVTVSSFGSMQSASTYIGALGYIDNSLAHQTSQYFNGSIDEVRIWNVARTQKQIELYKNNRLSGTEIGLKAYFPFETYEEVMGVMLSTPTINDQSVDPYSETDANYCGTATEFGENGYSTISPNIRRERAIANVNFDYVINNDKIIITPTEELAMIEKCVLEITVQNIQDKHANKMASPATWTAYIKKNQVVWGDDMFDLEKELSESLSFSTTIVNKGGTQQNFSISNLPNWLSANPEMGTIDPDSELEIKFTVNDGLNIGNYSEDVFLTSNSGYNERLSLNLRVFKQAPIWVVDETAYQSSMNVIAQLSIKDVISNDKYDKIGVFSGDVCRGVCNLEYKANYDSYFAFLVVYGNKSDEELSYKVWDASEGKVYTDVSPTYNFEPNKFYGNMATPIVFDAGSKLNNSITLNKGWSWLSFNLLIDNAEIGSVFKAVNLTQGDVVKHAEVFTSFDNQTGLWFGSLASVEIGKMYQTKIQQGGTLTFMGSETKASDFAIQLVNGWNRIGFIPNENMTVNEALAGFEPQINDVVKSQYQFAMYDGYEWIGSMNYMEPGKGYMYKSANVDPITFVYPNASELNQKSAVADLNSESADFGIEPGNYEYAMSLVAHVNTNELPEGTMLGAYLNNQLRGVASIASVNGFSNYSYVTVYGNTADMNDEVLFKLLTDNKVIEVEGLSYFAGNGIAGDLHNPIEINVGKALNVISKAVYGLEVYPNPFSNSTTISFALETQAEVLIEVYDVLGNKLDVLAAESMSAGSHNLIWDAASAGSDSEIAQGVYFIHVKIDNTKQVLRIIKE